MTLLLLASTEISFTDGSTAGMACGDESWWHCSEVGNGGSVIQFGDIVVM